MVCPAKKCFPGNYLEPFSTIYNSCSSPSHSVIWGACNFFLVLELLLSIDISDDRTSVSEWYGYCKHTFFWCVVWWVDFSVLSFFAINPYFTSAGVFDVPVAVTLGCAAVQIAHRCL
jgi:hypothetical protein